jgi:hypothetical protein
LFRTGRRSISGGGWAPPKGIKTPAAVSALDRSDAPDCLQGDAQGLVRLGKCRGRRLSAGAMAAPDRASSNAHDAERPEQPTRLPISAP